MSPSLASCVLLSAMGTLCLLLVNYPASVDAMVIDNLQRFELNRMKLEFDKHQARVNSYKCRHPRHRAVSATGWFDLTSEESVDPEMTVLHLCDAGAGCCDATELCVPVERKSVDVELVFQIKNMMTHEVRYESVVRSNHTQCRCQGADSPK